MATIFKLIIEDDEGKTTVYPLADGNLTIGRKEGNTIRLMERNVSRRHARLERTNGAVFIQDLDSYNGVKINGERISGRYEVKEGDLVEIGDYHLALQKSVTRSEAPEPVAAYAAGGAAEVGTWPQPGTVPDFQLPDELLTDAPVPEGSARDTVIDQPVPAGLPNIVAQTVDERPKPVNPVEESPSQLPSFPGAAPETRPVRALPEPRPATAESGREAPASTLSPGPDVVSDVPRLICVSTTYAGQAFALTRPELIIGRVEDNDIVIEHRSVSRNHAKILYDGRTHKIIDLQSANGILVNGEEYAMTDLRKGDLIELGHVRFRFVPASEAYRPTAEEAQQMRAAGVTPPPMASEDPDEPLDAIRTERPAEVATYDPSQAATVTDAPLEPSAVHPSVEPVPLPTEPLHTNGISAPAAMAAPAAAKPTTPRSLRTTQNDRPTELNRVPTGSVPAPLASPVDPHAAMVRGATAVDPTPAPPRRRTFPMVAAIALLAISVFAAVVLLIDSFKQDDAPDRELRRLFSAKQYEEAAAHCDQFAGRFADEGEASGLCAAARDLLQAARVDSEDIEPFAEPDIEAPPDEEPVPEPEPEIEEPSPVKPAPPPPPPPPPPATPTVSARQKRLQAARRAAARKASLVRSLVERGKRLVINGDFARAEKTLKECLRLEPNQPDCHRNLGVLYAQQDQTASAIRHYRRYVELRPNAGDAGRVREILKKFEGSP